jgi:hypothetical protein
MSYRNMRYSRVVAQAMVLSLVTCLTDVAWGGSLVVSFVRDSAGNYTSLTDPGAGGTFGAGIKDGAIVGSLTNPGGPQSFQTQVTELREFGGDFRLKIDVSPIPMD